MRGIKPDAENLKNVKPDEKSLQLKGFLKGKTQEYKGVGFENGLCLKR